MLRGFLWFLFYTFGLSQLSVAEDKLEPPRPGMFLVAKDDCGNPAGQSHLIAGQNWTITAEENAGLTISQDRYHTFAFDDQRVVLRYLGLRANAKYTLRVHYFNVAHQRTVRLLAGGKELHTPLELPIGKAIVREVEVPPAAIHSTMLTLSCEKVAGQSALVSAVELWSNVEGLLGPTGNFIRFRVAALPTGQDRLKITALMKIHASPWNTPQFPLTPKEDVSVAGLTPWVNLGAQPGNANGSLMLTIPPGARGTTQFAIIADDGAVVREIDWNEPDGTRIIVEPGLLDVRTFREQERRYYLRSLEQTGGRLFPLTRPPLFFSNAWGYTTGGAAEYMVKTFRLLGFNSVVTSADAAKYETLYGWHSQAGHYGPPGFVPYDAAASLAQYKTHYESYFASGKGKEAAPGMRIFQLADEPGDVNVNAQQAQAGFTNWLAEQGLKPELFGQKSWDQVVWSLPGGESPEQLRLHYWSRQYQRYLTPKMYGLAAQAIRESLPGGKVQSYVALSGHALYMPSKMPLDMFQLAQYPGLMPGISDWMTSGSWNWDSHQAVAFSVAPFNAGARRYGAEFGQAPKSFPMMHCVGPSLFRSFTQLANQCKLISYYNYGPDYEVTEGHWSASGLGYAVHYLNNSAAQMDDILGPGQMRPSRVALLYSDPQEVWWPQGSFADKRATFLALSQNYYQPELVTEEQIRAGALQHYDALYVLEQFVSRDVQDQIGKWVNGGGLLWACADAAVRDEYKQSYDLLDKLAGLRRDFSQPPLKASVQLLPVAGETAFPEHEVPPQGRSGETIRPCVSTWPTGKIRANYSDGPLALAEQQIGKGKLVYLGHRAGLSYSRRAGARGPFKWWPESRRELLFVPLVEAKVERELTLSTPMVMASPISTEAGTVILLYNMAPEPRTDLTIELKEPARPHSVEWCNTAQQMEALPFEYAQGRVKISGFDLPHNGAMIVVRRQAAPVDARLEQMRAAAAKHLAAQDWQTASAGAWFAGFYPEWKLAPQLPPLLQHEHWAVRRSAAETIGRLKYTTAAKPLRAALEKETDAHALADELFALAQLGHPEARALCEKYQLSPDPFLRREAARAAELLTGPGK